MQKSHSATEIQEWLVQQIADELQIESDQIDVNQPILAQGVDSMHAVAIVAKLEDWLGTRFTSDPLEDSPSIAMLSRSLSKEPDNEQVLP